MKYSRYARIICQVLACEIRGGITLHEADDPIAGSKAPDMGVYFGLLRGT